MPPLEHDQRFKVLLKEFVESFFQLFWPERSRLFDFSRVEWLDTEAFPDPPLGTRRSLDLVARLPLVQELQSAQDTGADAMVAIIHVEVESADSVAPLRKRMFQYYAHLRQKYAEPVLPVAVYLRVGLDGLGADVYTEAFGDFEVLRYNFLYVGFPALDAQTYLQQDNWLGVALSALMRIQADRRAWHRAEALNRVLCSPVNEYRKYLLAECVQAYLPLNQPEEQQEFERLLATDQYQEVQRMAVTWFEQGLEQGLERGLEQGERKLALAVLERRFGSVSDELRRCVDQWPEDKLAELIDRAYQVTSAEELPIRDTDQTT